MGALFSLEFVKRFWPAIVLGLAIIGIAFSIWNYGRGRYNEGVRVTTEAYEVKLTACNAKVKAVLDANAVAQAAIRTLQELYGDLDTAVRDLQAREIDARARADKALAEALKRERAAVHEIAKLRKIIGEPKVATPELACQASLDLLEAAAERRAP